MKLTNTAEVAAPIAEVFAALNEPERIVSCMPDAELVSSDGDRHTGRVKVKVGPIAASFEGTVTYVESDKTAHRIVVRGSGSDTTGNGNAEATVTLTLDAIGPDRTNLIVDTDLLIKGKFVQFGKAAVEAVARRVLGQFAENLSSLLASGEEAPGSVDPSEAGATVPTASTGATQTPASSEAYESRAPFWQLALVFVAGCVQGWILTRAFGRRR